MAWAAWPETLNHPRRNSSRRNWRRARLSPRRSERKSVVSWRGATRCRLTTQAQRPGPRGRSIATGARWPGSLQRMVRPLRVSLQSHKLSCVETLPPVPAVTERAKPNRARICNCIRTRNRNGRSHGRGCAHTGSRRTHGCAVNLPATLAPSFALTDRDSGNRMTWGAA